MEQQDDRENLSGLEYTAYMSWVALADKELQQDKEDENENK
jgi:hypothetical protein